MDEECLCFLDQRKQAKTQWVQDPNQSNVDNLNFVKHESIRHFRNKEKEFLKDEIDEFETNSKIKNIRELCRGISDFMKCYQPRTNIVKDEKGDCLQTPTIFSLVGENISLSCSMYMGLVMLGRKKYH